MAAASVCVFSGSSSCLFPLSEALQNQNVGLIRLLPNYCFSVWGVRVCEILRAPFKNEVCVSFSPLALPRECSVGLQNEGILRGHLPSAEALGWEAQCEAWTLHSLGKTSAVVIILLFVGCLPRCFDNSAPSTRLVVVSSLYL